MERETAKEDFALRVSRADGRYGSWRQKLAWVGEVLEDEGPGIGLEELACLAVYFRFMGNGDISFSEDGGHYRPSHHAKTARRIHERLSAIKTPENGFVIRKIVPWLPSYGDAFTRAEPLTRIRDIAHRNDIPQELKREIKTTLQNKLHRCAGPEDLVTSKRLLDRITAPEAAYSPDFVQAFKRFHEELTEFFNARSLDGQLAGILTEEDLPRNRLIREFLRAKERTGSPKERVAALEALTRLRDRIGQDLEDAEGARAQELEVADIRLEEVGFVLLSRLSNDLEGQRNGIDWKWAFCCLRLAIRNLRLSGLEPEECGMLESELELRSQGWDPSDREHLLYLKSLLDRAGRLAEGYCSRILSLFPAEAERLGRLLGVSDSAIRVFAEADIRSHPVFQFSKLAAFLQKRIRVMASLPPWDVIVPGRTGGRLVRMARLDEAEGPAGERIVALLERLEGDEEIPPGVSAILVFEETPHLSHIAVRARQQGVVFAVCEEEELRRGLGNLSDRTVALKASPEGVDIEPSSDNQSHGTAEIAGKSKAVRASPPEVRFSPGRALLTLEEVTPETGGGKAYGARRLEELANKKGAGFKTPPGVVIPFGVMEESFHGLPDLEEEYRQLMETLNRSSRDGFAGGLKRLREIVEQLQIPETVVSGLRERLAPEDRLMVRSSSNGEDLESMAGAGLHESVANAGLQDAAQAVRKVWASLWTPRAAASRRNLGIPHDRAHMAVLVQRMQVPGVLSFIMHTVHPVTHNRDEVYVELAVGLGETLASGRAAGTPYRLSYSKRTGETRLLAFATLRHALWPGKAGGLVAGQVDYAAVEFSQNREYRARLTGRLGEIGRRVEASFGGPQDIEGLVCGDEVWLVQSRPQQREV